MYSPASLDSDDRVVARRPWGLIALALLLVAVLALRLFHLQVLSWRVYLDQSDERRITRLVIEAPRGGIYDRNGVVLAENRPSYSITIDPFARSRYDETIPKLARLLGEDPDAMLEEARQITRGHSNPQKIRKHVDFRTLSRVMERLSELPGVGDRYDQRRLYPEGTLAAHILGYTGELNEQEYEALRDSGYHLGHSIGKSGIEKRYESVLKGKNGARFEEMNNVSRYLGRLEEYKPDPPVPGRDVHLTIDARLQRVAEAAFADTLNGSFVALDPRTGEVLVMASSPSFDPNAFARVMSAGEYSALMNDPDRPMFNRAIQAAYPPGSTFKMLTGIAGLESGLSPDKTFRACTGQFWYGRYYKCWAWEKGGHGTLDLAGAIENSCNIYFYQMGISVGLDMWSETGEKLGFGTVTGIDIDNEEAGVLPSAGYYERAGVEYSRGMILNLSIGQGENLVTALQLAQYVGIIATKGLRVTPRLNIDELEPPRQAVSIPEESFEAIRTGMKGVVHGSHGTARSVAIPGHFIAGKTGTVQNPHGADHKIFVAFTPYDDPAIVTACVVENAGDLIGSRAVMFTKDVLDAYFTYYPDNTVVADGSR